jgi:hypothetical protein
MTYHVETLPNGLHFATALQNGRVVAASIITGKLTNRSLVHLKSSTRPYWKTVHRVLSLFR